MKATTDRTKRRIDRQTGEDRAGKQPLGRSSRVHQHRHCHLLCDRRRGGQKRPRPVLVERGRARWRVDVRAPRSPWPEVEDVGSASIQIKRDSDQLAQGVCSCAAGSNGCNPTWKHVVEYFENMGGCETKCLNKANQDSQLWGSTCLVDRWVMICHPTKCSTWKPTQPLEWRDRVEYHGNFSDACAASRDALTRQDKLPHARYFEVLDVLSYKSFSRYEPI